MPALTYTPYCSRLEAPLKTQYQFLVMIRILLFCVAEEAEPVSQFAVDRDIVEDFALYWQLTLAINLYLKPCVDLVQKRILLLCTGWPE